MIFLLMALSTGAMMISFMLMQGMQSGLSITQERLGADVVIVPEDYISTVEGSLFEGKLCTSYFDAGLLDKVYSENAEAVDKISAQLYIATLPNATCCNNAIQLIAINQKTDFTVSPWLKENGIADISDQEIIFGSNANVKKGDTVEYFGREFVVAGVLDESGMGYDNSAFITYDAANKIADSPEYTERFSFGSQHPAISMIQIDVKEGTDIDAMVNRINTTYKQHGLSAYRTSNLLSGFRKSVANFQIFGKVTVIMTILLSLTALFSLLTMAVDQRRREFGCMLTVGIEKLQILQMLFWELIILVLTATIVGSGSVVVLMLFFRSAMETYINVPFKLPAGGSIAVLTALLLLINFTESVAAMAYSFYRIRKAKPALMIKEI
jgi:putative ABC transport system permease protein